jgi:DNA-binding NtrC family response regulator
MATNAEFEDMLGMIERLEGDVRHLKHAIERVLHPEPVLPPPSPLDEVERGHIMDVLRQTGGNRVAAARVLGISRRSLYRRLDRHQIEYGARSRENALHD